MTTTAPSPDQPAPDQHGREHRAMLPVPVAAPAPAKRKFDPAGAVRRCRADLARFLAQLTIAQAGLIAAALLMALGLALLPPPVDAAHLMLLVGAVMAVLAATYAPRLPAMAAKPVTNVERHIEDLKDAQWELRENETRYRDLLDAQADVILRRDADGRLSFVNAAACRVWDRSAHDLLGKPLPLVVRDGANPALPVDGSPRAAFEQAIETAAGVRWFAWAEHAIPAGADAAPGVRAVQMVGRDITVARAAQAELAEARDAAQAASLAKSRFLAMMSHEIRTPMNGILGMTSLLAETGQTPEQETYTRAVGQSARALLALIDEILDFSKIEAGRLELRAAEFALDEAVQGVVELLAAEAHAKGLQIAWSFAPGVPKRVVGDETRLRQILVNLVGNAIKFTERGGIAVTVSMGANGENTGDGIAIRLTVRDTGIGLSEAAARTIFGEFVQADMGPARRHPGTGLGLAISRRLARAMGGDVSVASTPGAGSTFTADVRLQVSPSATVTDEKPATALKHVILAMTGTIEAEAIAQTLRAHGHAASLVDEDEGGEPPATEVTTLIVDADCDPDTAGRRLAEARTAAAARGLAPVRGIVAVATGERERLRPFRARGFTGYLIRPVRPGSLLAQVTASETSAPGGFTRMPASAPDSAAVQLPVAHSLAGAVAVITRARPRTRLDVLLAEDNEIGALLATTMLERTGCRVCRVASGEAAVAAWRAGPAAGGRAFDLVLMDMHMPGMDGLEATRAIRRLEAQSCSNVASAAPRTPIVALTANAFAEDRSSCLQAGMDDHIAKPFDRADLMAKLDRWCRPAEARCHGLIEVDAVA